MQYCNTDFINQTILTSINGFKSGVSESNPPCKSLTTWQKPYWQKKIPTETPFFLARHNQNERCLLFPSHMLLCVRCLDHCLGIEDTETVNDVH